MIGGEAISMLAISVFESFASHVLGDVCVSDAAGSVTLASPRAGAVQLMISGPTVTLSDEGCP